MIWFFNTGLKNQHRPSGPKKVETRFIASLLFLLDYIRFIKFLLYPSSVNSLTHFSMKPYQSQTDNEHHSSATAHKLH